MYVIRITFDNPRFVLKGTNNLYPTGLQIVPINRVNVDTKGIFDYFIYYFFLFYYIYYAHVFIYLFLFFYYPLTFILYAYYITFVNNQSAFVRRTFPVYLYKNSGILSCLCACIYNIIYIYIYEYMCIRYAYCHQQYNV